MTYSQVKNTIDISRLISLAAGAVGKPGTTADKKIEPMNWNQPRCFTAEQITLVEKLIAQMLEKMTVSFENFCPAGVKIKYLGMNVRYGNELIKDVLSNSGSFYTAFGADIKNPVGAIIITAQAAAELMNLLMGETEQNAQKQFSPMEISIISDICRAFIKDLCSVNEKWRFDKISKMQQGRLDAEIKSADEFCHIKFGPAQGEKQPAYECGIIISAALFKQALAIEQTPLKQSARSISAEQVIEHIGSTPVHFTAVLTEEKLNFADVINLSAGDILVLNKNAGGQIELRLDDRAVFRGFCARSNGNYAVMISELIRK